LASETIHIAAAADQRYLPHVATLIESLASSNPPAAIAFHFLHDGSVTARAQERLRGACDRHGLALEILEPPPDLEGSLPAVLRSARYPDLIWYRIWLADLLQPVERALYLDADTLVLQDLRALWSTDLEGCLLGAVRGGLPPERAHDPVHFNSGVLLMDLKRMRDEGFAQHLLEVGRTFAAEPEYPDQHALNLACEGSWLALHPRWNVCASLYLHADTGAYARSSVALGEAMASPAILHFEGPIFSRPWHRRCIHPHRELYRVYRSRTPWPLPALEGSGVKDRMLSRLPLGGQLALSRLRRRATGLRSGQVR
jgi:lipopolysaccharide biosynthesis glycosyltransferase